MADVDDLAKLRASGALPSAQQRERVHQERTQKIAQDLEDKAKTPTSCAGYTFHTHPGAP